MNWTIPGTVLTQPRAEAAHIREQFSSMFLGGGLLLSQVSGITGLEAYTVQNWVKRGFLSPPEKKRYSKEHMLLLIFIYYFKNILSINDIQTLLGPITEKYFKSDTDKNLTYIYNEVFSLEHAQIENLKKDLVKRYSAAESTFEDAPEEDQEFLKQFSFICLLSFDVYVKKLIIEKMIDSYKEGQMENSDKGKQKKS